MAISPGPRERKLRNRLIFELTGRWPESVVSERLAIMDCGWDRSNVDVILNEVWGLPQGDTFRPWEKP